MAEVWYLEIEASDLSGKEPRYRIEFQECIALFELSAGRWRSAPEEIPQLKTGNPLIDESGYVYVYIRVRQDEIESLGIRRVESRVVLLSTHPNRSRKKVEE